MAPVKATVPRLPNRRNISSGLSMAPNGPGNAEIGILLLYMGGPDCVETVGPFLHNIFSDPKIIRLPGGAIGQFILGRLIVGIRLTRVKADYQRIGGGSPITHWTTLQMQGLQERLMDRLPRPPKVGMAMRYWHPFADEALRELAASGVKHAIGLTLYPHYSRATTGSGEDDLVATRDRLGLDIPISFISHWCDNPLYLDLWASKVKTALDGLVPEVRARIQLVVSAHGLPRKFVESGDQYLEHIKSTMEGVLARLHDVPPAHLCFQSRSGPVRWIGPRTEDVIEELASQGHDALLIWPISFVSDHIETLHEIGVLLREKSKMAGILEYHVVPSFNDDPGFRDVLADLVATHIEKLDTAPTH